MVWRQQLQVRDEGGCSTLAVASTRLARSTPNCGTGAARRRQCTSQNRVPCTCMHIHYYHSTSWALHSTACEVLWRQRARHSKPEIHEADSRGTLLNKNRLCHWLVPMLRDRRGTGNGDRTELQVRRGIIRVHRTVVTPPRSRSGGRAQHASVQNTQRLQHCIAYVVQPAR